MSDFRQKLKGVTLLEVLLVLAISSSLLVLMLNYTTQKSNELRRDKTVLQVQQILNAGMSFYVSNSFWPVGGNDISNSGCGNWTTIDVLKTNSYIPSTLNNNPYGVPYGVTCNTVPNGGGFFVLAVINTAANAEIIAGRLPLAYRTTQPVANLSTGLPTPCTSGTDCRVVIANVNIPGQNLNNARSVNFASVYYSGSCVPAPNCPPNMSPDILVFPASVSGINKDLTTCQGTSYDPSTCTFALNPLSSFTAYAVGGTGSKAGKPVPPFVSGDGPPVDCGGTRIRSCIKSYPDTLIDDNGGLYWRVCLSVTTDQGLVKPGYETEGNAQRLGKGMGSIVAITRCVPNLGNEQPSGAVDIFQGILNQ